MRTKALAVMFLVTVATFFGCSNPSGSETPSIETIEFMTVADGYSRFSTNDSEKHGSTHYYYVTDSNETTMTTVEITAIKKSGASHYGYGLAFCYQDVNNFYRVLITKNGSFRVQKKQGGTYSTPLQDWTASSDLVTGYDQPNIIKVVRTGADSFSIYFNNASTPAFSFSDTTGTQTFNGGYGAFIASVGEATDEDFPDVAADFRFKMNQPVLAP